MKKTLLLFVAMFGVLVLTATAMPEPEPEMEPEMEPEPEHEPEMEPEYEPMMEPEYEPEPEPEMMNMPEKMAATVMERMGMRDDLAHMLQEHMGEAQQLLSSMINMGPSMDAARGLVMQIMEMYVDFEDLTGLPHGVPPGGAVMPGPGGFFMMDCKPVATRRALMTVAKEKGLNSFMGLAMAARMVTKLQNMPGPFTLFIAGEDAILKDQENLDKVMQDPKLMKKTLKYHIVPRMLKAADITDGLEVMTLMREPLKFSVSDAGVSINGGEAMVVEADIEADNGCIHIIDNLMTPPMKPKPTSNLVELATSKGLTTLVSLLEAAGLAETIATTENLTIFAPSDEAFSKVPKETLDALAADTELLASVLTYHVVPDIIKSYTLDKMGKPRILVNTLADIGIGITADKKSMKRYSFAKDVKVAGNKLTSMDHMATNGVLHVMDGVMIPPTKSLLEMIEEDPELSTFLAAVKAAGMTDRLSMRPGSTSVRAPHNRAFEELPAGKLDALLADIPSLQMLLGLHIKDHSDMFKKPGPVKKKPMMMESMMPGMGPLKPVMKPMPGPVGQAIRKHITKKMKQGIKATNGMLYKINMVLM